MKSLLKFFSVILLVLIFNTSKAFAEKIVFLPSVVGVPFFNSESKGFEEACAEIGCEVIYTAPEKGTAEETSALINSLMLQGVDAINFVPTDPTALMAISEKAMGKGIAMLENGSINMAGSTTIGVLIAHPDQVGEVLMELAHEMTDGEGEFAVLSAASTSTAQNSWIDGMKKAMDADSKYSKMNWVATVYGDDIREKSAAEAQGLIAAYPNLKAIVSPTSVGIAATGQVVTDQGLIGKVKVTGLGLPSEMIDYVKNGASTKFAIWNPVDLGYFNAYVSHAAAQGILTGKVGETFSAGRMGDYTVEVEGEITFGNIFRFDASNIDEGAKLF
tara:strand:+ start:1063 stop:2055 length:993 start_codon:yes stop_codon:yes gene_type:complete